MKTGENPFPSAQGLLSMLLSSAKFVFAIKLIRAVKVKAHTKSQHKYSEALLPQMSYIASNVLHKIRGLPNNLHNMATDHSYLDTKTWQSS